MTAELSPELIASLTALPEAVDRLHRALIGDPEVGHRGVVERLAEFDLIERQIPSLHAELDARRVEGDKRVHERVDMLEERMEIELAALDEKFGAAIEGSRADSRSIARKLDRMMWVAAGALAVTGGGVGFLIQQFTGTGP